MNGSFITFEGSEGSGKSTQIELAKHYLEERGKAVLFVREPGGVRISEEIRRILLDPENKDMGRETETLLYMAARAQLVDEVIIPNLEAGKVILCDRFLDSTVAYQGYGSGVDIDKIKNIGAIVTRGRAPDLTVLFDIDVNEGLARINRPKDRIELRDTAYHDRVRKGYLKIAEEEPGRVKVVDARKNKDDIQAEVREYLNTLLGLS